MKKVICLFILVLGIFFGSVAFAETKTLGLEEPVGLGTPTISIEMSEFFHHRTMKKYDKAVFFDEESQKLTFLEGWVSQGAEEFSWHILFLIVGFLLMAHSNHRIGRHGERDTFGIISFSLAVFLIAFAFLTAFVSCFITLSAALFTLGSLCFVLSSVLDLEKPNFLIYKIFSRMAYSAGLAVIVNYMLS